MKAAYHYLNNYIDIRYYVKFALLFITFYYAYLLLVGITTPGGTFSPFVSNYLNLPAFIRNSVLNGAHWIVSASGTPSFVTSDSLVDQWGVKTVKMGWPCYGLMLKSFWLAFILAKPLSWRKRAGWSLVGVCAIWSINCMRIAILYLSLHYDWSIGAYLNTNNHDLFNYFAYVILLILVVLAPRHQQPASTTTLPILPA